MPTASGTTRDYAGALAQKLVRLYRRDSGAYVASALSDAETGVWSIAAADTSEHFAIEHDGAGDPLWGKVAVSMPFTSALTDGKSNTFTTVGGAALTSTNPKFTGTQSLGLNGSTDYLSCASPNFSFGSNDFAIEAHARHATGVGDGCIVSKANSYNVGVNFMLKIFNSGGTILQLIADFGGTGLGNCNINTTADASIVMTNWNHYRAERVGNVIKLYINGVLKLTSSAISGAMFSNSEPLLIGSGKYSGSPNYFMNGAISDLRITNGAYRSGAAFTPSISPNLLAISGGTQNAVIRDRIIPI